MIFFKFFCKGVKIIEEEVIFPEVRTFYLNKMLSIKKILKI